MGALGTSGGMTQNEVSKWKFCFFSSETAELRLSVIYKFDFSSFKPFFLFPINHFMEMATYYSFFVLELNYPLNEGGLEK